MEPRQTPAEEREEQRRRERVVEEHLGLVRQVAGRYERRGRESGFEFEDLCQEGVIGLLAAADTFNGVDVNPQTGQPYGWSTWAVWKIEARIRRAIRDGNGLVRVPAHVYAAGHREQATSLERERHIDSTGDGVTLAEMLPDPRVDVAGEVVARVADEELQALLVGLVNAGTLTLVEGYVVCRIAGYLPPPAGSVDSAEGDRPHKMLSIIARERGVSRERIRQVRNAAWAKLAPHLAAWDSPETVRVLSSAVRATTRRTAQTQKTTKPADTTPKAANRNGVHATGVSSTGNGLELLSGQPSRKQFKRTGTPRRAKNSTNAA